MVRSSSGTWLNGDDAALSGLRAVRAVPEDAKRMAALMLEVKRGLDNPDYYVVSDEERVRRKLQTDSFAYLVEDGEVLAALFVFQVPGARNRDDNPGVELGFTDETLDRVMVADSVAVLPAYRGRGLQSRLLEMGESDGRGRGLDLFMATVDPRNVHSLRNLTKAGYHIVWTGEMFGGLPRHILLKDVGGVR